MGRVPRGKKFFEQLASCGRLVLQKGFDHFVLWEERCYSSHDLPGNVYKMNDPNKKPEKNHREWNFPYFIKGASKSQCLMLNEKLFCQKR